MLRLSPLLVLAILAMAGCSGPPTTDSKDEVPQSADEFIDLGGFGAVAGRVTDESNRSVPGALVSPVDSNHTAATTGPDGLFRFEGLRPGPAKLHVLAEGFKVRLIDFTVVADRVVRMEIPLFPLETIGPSYRLHLHDYWRGADTYTMMDEAFVVTEKPVAEGVNPQLYEAYTVCNANTNHTCTGPRWIPLPQSEPGHPVMVIPGTGRIEVTLTWQGPEMQTDELGLGYVSPTSEERQWLGTRASGEAWNIPVTFEEADSGHQEWTHWRFFVYFPNTATSPDSWEPTVAKGAEIHAQITLHRSLEPYLEPAHPTFWNGSTELEVMDGEWDVNPYNLGSPGGDSIYSAYLPKGKLVPPGTQRLVIDFSWDMAQLNGAYEQRLKWRTAEQNPANTPVADFKTAEHTSCGDRCLRFELDIDSRTADQVYQKKSGWSFYPHPEPHGDTHVWAEQTTRYFAKITAYKDPGYDEPYRV